MEARRTETHMNKLLDVFQFKAESSFGFSKKH